MERDLRRGRGGRNQEDGYTDEILPPRFRVDRPQRPLGGLNPGVVDQDVRVPVRGADLGEQRADLGRVRDVGRDGQRLHGGVLVGWSELGQLGGDLAEAFRVPGHEDDGLGAGFGEGWGESLGKMGGGEEGGGVSALGSFSDG